MRMHSEWVLKVKKVISSCLSFCTREAYPSSTSTGDDKSTKKDPETNVYTLNFHLCLNTNA